MDAQGFVSASTMPGTRPQLLPYEWNRPQLSRERLVVAKAFGADNDREVFQDADKSLPRFGVLATHPIQYQAPLYQELSRRGLVNLNVAFLESKGAVPHYDRDFG